VTKRSGKKPDPASPGQLMLIRDMDSAVLEKIGKRRIECGMPTPIQKRLIDSMSDSGDPTSLLFQHTVLCQTGLPYRDPGDARIWEQVNGGIRLRVSAGSGTHPDTGKFIELGLPFGPKARMILMHINADALKNQSPIVDVQETLTTFVRRSLGLDPSGRNVKLVKEQLARLAASSILLGIVRDGHGITIKANVIRTFDLWFPKNENERVLWPSQIELSLDYWESLRRHAVPLDESHIAALSHSSMALDIYAWLACRLHRVPPNKPCTVSWPSLQAQFGQGYGRLRNFRRDFLEALKQVQTLYKGAHIDLHQQRNPPVRVEMNGLLVWREETAPGLTLYNSPPPVPPKTVSVL
jgi:hypothetical protein